ncbi:MAG: potassium channel family protein [Desulfatibacillaceae bacterium]
MLFFIRLRKYVVRHRPGAWLVTASVLFALAYGLLGFRYLEGRPWDDSLYWTVTTMSTVGYGDLSPATGWGRLHAMLLMVMGIGIFGMVVESFVSILFEQAEKRRTGMIKVKDKGHILICGWSETVRECLLELENMGEDVYVLSMGQAVRDEMEHIRSQAVFVKGDPTRWEALERAGADRASAIIIDLETDSEALDCVITLRRRTAARVVVEVERAENQQKFLDAGADELTIPFVLSGRLMAQSRQKRFLARFVTEVISTNVGMSLEEIEVVPGDPLVGKNLKELAGPEYLPDMYIVAVGRGSELKVDTSGTLSIEPGDHIICLKQGGG